jgi:hypothetical protein
MLKMDVFPLLGLPASAAFIFLSINIEIVIPAEAEIHKSRQSNVIPYPTNTIITGYSRVPILA